MSLLDAITCGELPSSKTHKARRWYWVATSDSSVGTLGTLTIVQGRREIDTYYVWPYGDAIVIANAATVAGEIYEVRGGVCNCKGHRHTNHCKHADAVAALAAEGVLQPQGVEA